jgi:fermentation-respiration switch protein FrsA (DUF1100 family)
MTAEIVLPVVLSCVAVYLLLNLFAFLVTDRLLFVPRTSSYQQLPGQVRIRSGSGQFVNAVHLEHPDAEYTLLFSHGNAEDLGNVVPSMMQFFELGYSVLMYDYRGYGTSEGSPSTRHAKEDVTAAYRWLVEVKGVDPRRIISHGRSLGGGVAVWLAAHHEVGGLITEISFASAIRVKTRWKILPWDRFDSLRSIRRVRCPVLVIHATDDEVIPFRHGRMVYEAASEPKHHLWIEGGRHTNYMYIDEQRYLAAIQQFLQGIP